MTTRSVGVPDWAVGVAITVALLLCYSAILVTPYAVTDDYVHLASAVRGGPFTFMSSIARGCYTSAYATWAAFQLSPSFDRLRFVRVLGVLGIGLLGYLVYRALVRAGWSRGQAAALGFLVGVTPPFQVCASWSVSFTVFYSCAFTGLACERVAAALEPAATPRQVWLRIAAAIGLLVVAVTIYQVTLMYFVVFAVIDLFRPDADPPRLWRRILVLGGTLAGGLVLGFAAYKLGIAIVGTDDLGAARSQMVSDFGEKAWYFVTGPFQEAMQLWKLWPVDHLPEAIGVATIVGLLLYFRGSWLRRLGFLGLALVGIPLVYLPNLMTAENWGAHRTQLGLTSLLVMYAFFAFHGYARVLRRAGERVTRPILWGAVLLAGVFAARNVAWYYADAQTTELAVARAQMRPLNLAATEQLYVNPADWQDAVTNVRADEYGLPTSSHIWGAKNMIYVLAAELGHRRPAFPITIAPPARLRMKPTEHLIDMRNLRFFAW